MSRRNKYIAIFAFFFVLCSFSVVNAAVDLPEGHSFKGWVVVKEADCTTDGLRTNTCRNCGLVVEDVIPALGHDWKLTSDTDATCTVQGLKTYTCTRCGDKKTEIEPALGHDYYVTETQPTESADGARITRCRRCDYEQVEILPALAAPEITEPPETEFAENPPAEVYVEDPPVMAYVEPSVSQHSTTVVPTPIPEESPPAQDTAGWAPNAVDAVLAGACIVISALGVAVLLPYIKVFRWYGRKRSEAIKKIFGG